MTHHGHVIKTIGDAFLVDFPSVVHAVQCAQQIQTQLRTHNAEKEQAEQIHVRIGIHLGDVVQRDGDVFGDGVNIASRLQTLAEPDTICILRRGLPGGREEAGLGDGGLAGQAQAQEHCRAVSGLCVTAGDPQGVRQTLASPTLEASRIVGTASVWQLGFGLTRRRNHLPPDSLVPLIPAVLSPRNQAAATAARQTLHRRAALRQHE